MLPTTEDSCITRFDYEGIRHFIDGKSHTIAGGAKLKAYNFKDVHATDATYLESGLEVGFEIPTSYFQSMLETLQLYQFIIVEQKVSLPIFQQIKNDACTDDEKIFLFLERIDDDPILLEALREDQRQYEKGELCYKKILGFYIN